MGLWAYFHLVAFRHSIFALPFALQGAWLAQRGVPAGSTLALVVGCAVSARTAAMGFNRLVDRRLDAANPRTAARELPQRRVSVRGAAAMVIAFSLCFVALAFALGPLCGALALPVLAVLFLYSFTKRFTWCSHLFLGLSLALAPLGAWLAVRGDFGGDMLLPILLALAVLCWVAGFDVLYSCQDVHFDRAQGLHSIPARFGVARALRLAAVLHAVVIVLLVLLWLRAELSWPFLASIALAAGLLTWEHRLVSPVDLSRLNLAFFTLNGWVGVLLFLGLAVDPAL